MSANSPSSAGATGRQIDLYCLNCGYNLRGLSDDPICCPECAFENPVGDVEIPAPIISEQLRRMESAPAAAAGGLMLTLLIALAPLLTSGMRYPVRWGDLRLLGILASIGVAFWVAGCCTFRQSCLGKPGWFGALVKYHLYAAVPVTLILAAFFSFAWAITRVSGRWFRAREAFPIQSVLNGVLFAIILAVVRWVGPWIQRRATVEMHVLQREVAVTLARDRTRHKLFRARPSWRE